MVLLNKFKKAAKTARKMNSVKITKKESGKASKAPAKMPLEDDNSDSDAGDTGASGSALELVPKLSASGAVSHKICLQLVLENRRKRKFQKIPKSWYAGPAHRIQKVSTLSFGW